MEKILFNAEVIRQFLALIMNRHFELNLKNVKIDFRYDQIKLISVILDGRIEYVPLKK